jgi:hypothetical protein
MSSSSNGTGRVPFKFQRPFKYGHGLGVGSCAPTGTVQFTWRDEQFQRIDAADTDRIVITPVGTRGSYVNYQNVTSGSGNITVNDGSSNTLAVLKASEWGDFFHNGTEWLTLNGRNSTTSTPSVTTPIASTTSPMSASAGDFIEATTGGSNFTVLLPNPGAVGDRVTVKKIDDGVGNVIISSNGGADIDGASTATLTDQYESCSIVKGTSVWWIE